MTPGTVVEYIDKGKIVCGVVMEVKSLRVRLLTEHNREVKVSVNRLCHRSDNHLDLTQARDQLVDRLKQISAHRKMLKDQVDVKEMWEILHTEQEWIDRATMAEFCFSEQCDADHESAVMRAFFHDPYYFKFHSDRFFPNSEERVAQIIAQAEESARKQRIIASGTGLLRRILGPDNGDTAPPQSPEETAALHILKSYYLHEKDSPTYDMAKAMAAAAGIKDPGNLFDPLVKLGVWDEDENTDLHRFNVSLSFPPAVEQRAAQLNRQREALTDTQSRRVDLTELPLVTIDGQATLDFDDALSIERAENGYRLGVHIADVAHRIQKEDVIDQEARERASAIYTPDQKIPMIPSELAEDLCSLKAGEIRPAISIMMWMNGDKQLVDYDIFPSWIQVKKQWSYYDVNLVAEEEEAVVVLHDIAQRFRQQRLEQGAVHISLPEVTVYLDSSGIPVVHRVNRESPGRMLVAEMMIMANWVMARFLSKHGMPAVFRSQPEIKERLYSGEEESLYKNWMQRKMLSRFVLGTEAEPHAGLGLDAYVTATSPIRKYFDLITQRQIRAVLGLEPAYTKDEMQQILQGLQTPMMHVSKIQSRRQRYWLLKYLEGMVGSKEEAIVLGERRNGYAVLLKAYMIETELPKTAGLHLKKEDLVQVTLQRVNARKDVLTVYLG